MSSVRTLEVSCNSCGSSNFAAFAQSRDYGYETCDNEFNFVQCSDCGHVYLHNRPDITELSVIYPKNYIAYNYDKSLNKVVLALRNRVQRSKILPLKKYVGTEGIIVDVGCGGSHYLDLVSAFGPPGWKTVGVDISAEAIRNVEKHGHLGVCGNFERLDWPMPAPKAIVMNQMIEHFEDPRAAMAKAMELLAPGGVLIMETPSLEGWDAHLFRRRYWGGWHTPRHWCVYSEKTIGDVLRRQGFEMAETTYLLNPWGWLHSVQYALKGHWGMPRVARFFEVTNIFALAAAGMVDVLQKAVRGKTSNMRVIARKPLHS